MTSLHPDYAAFHFLWEKCLDAEEGEERVKSKDDTYLPKLADPDAYPAYKARAQFFDILGCTKNGLAGLVFRKDPSYELPPALGYLEKAADMDGNDLWVVSRELLLQAINPSRVAILVDAQQDDLPRLVLFRAQQILDWETTRMPDGTRKLTRVLLEEEPEDDPRNYSRVTRELFIRDGIYVHRVWRGETSTEIVPTTARGQPLDFIPLVICNKSDFNLRPSKPLLLPLANLDFSLYRSSADLEHARHYTACPQAYVTGAINADGKKWTIGPSHVWELPENATCGYLDTADLAGLEKAVDQKLDHAVRIGATLVDPRQVHNEVAEAARIRQAAKTSLLDIVTHTAGVAMERALRWVAIFAAENPDRVRFEYNTDFFPEKLDPQSLMALVNAWQQGAISSEDYALQLHKADVIASTRNLDEEVARLEKSRADARIAEEKKQQAALAAKQSGPPQA